MCLLVLTFTIAECGLSQDKRQNECTLNSDLQSCITRIGQVTPETATDNVFCNECSYRDELLDYAERCTPGALQGYKDTLNMVCTNDDNKDDDDDDEERRLWCSYCCWSYYFLHHLSSSGSCSLSYELTDSEHYYMHCIVERIFCIGCKN